MKYAIILPVRNGGNYVKECVSSILQQTLKDFDLIILDNCSTDGTSEWLSGLTDSRIKIVPAEKPLTIEENWARIKYISKPPFITLIGHDDVLAPDYLSEMDRLIEKHPGASLYQTHFSYIDSIGKPIRACKPMDEVQSAEEFLAFFLCSMIDVMGTGFMMRSADYDAIGGIPARYPNLLFADFELFINLASKSYKATSPKECFSFRLHQSMTTTSSDIRFHQAYDIFIAYLEELREENDTYKSIIEKYALQFISFYSKGLSHRLLRTPMNKRDGKSVKQFLSLSKSYADRLVPGNNFDPNNQFSVRIANNIDSNLLLRGMFLTFKKFYRKPVYS